MRISRFLIFALLAVSCIEPYEFYITDKTKALVVEAFLSDKSFAETVLYPSDGRYFTVHLRETSDVTNVRSQPVTGATVHLLDDTGASWAYSEGDISLPGTYSLIDDAFKAEVNRRYRLAISVGEDFYESIWEQLPTAIQPPMGQISFQETERQTFVMEANERVLRTIREVTTNIELHQNTSGEVLYYQWKFSPTWIYKAPLSPGSTAPGYICWASDTNYLNTYALQKDLAGGYKKDLFRVPTIRNERIYEEFSVLITQYAMRDDYFAFWQEMQNQAEGNSLIDQPPFNLQTNFQHIGGDKKVSGFFGVVREDARRWYFNKGDLSYAVQNTLLADCLVDYGPPIGGCPVPMPPVACECKHCLDYSFGTTTNIKPAWWAR